MPLDISVIVPCFNQAGFLAKCLESLTAQSFPRDRYEVIVVDNASEDDSAAVARRFPGVVVLTETKRGSYAARNAGVRASRGAILAFTDSDCQVAPDWLARIAETLSGQSVAVAQGGRRFAHESFALAIAADYEHQRALYVFSGGAHDCWYGYTNNLATRREVFDRIGPFHELKRGGDTVFVSKVVQAYGGAAVRYIPTMAIRHLEIERARDWLGKMWTYGRSYAVFQTLSQTRPLGFGQRWEIVRRTARDARYGPLRVAVLGLMSVAATIAYEAGRITGDS